MPDMNGEQTLRELKKIRPEIPVVLLTAYAEDEARLCTVRPHLAGFVAKPFAYEELILAVKTALHQERTPLPEAEAEPNRIERLASVDR